jgi:hypothetical protein
MQIIWAKKRQLIAQLAFALLLIFYMRFAVKAVHYLRVNHHQITC